MIHESKFNRGSGGFAPLILLIIIAAAVAAAGGAGYLVYRSSKPVAKQTAQAPITDKASGQQPASGQAQDEIGSLGISAPTFEMPSSSALPGLETSALNVSSASLPGTGVFRDFSANTDASYSYKLDIPLPEVELDIPAPAAEPAADSGTGTGNGQGAPSAATCVQFSSMPSAQYCGAVSDPSGKALCEQCKAVGL